MTDMNDSTSIQVFSLNHTTRSLRELQSGSFTGEHLQAIRARLDAVCSEICILSTCNRFELIACSTQPELVAAHVLECVESIGDGSLQSQIEVLENEHAVRHLFRMVCGLESVINGDAQILGQVKEAFQQACSQATVGRVFNLVFPRAFSTAKRVRHETGLGKGRLSISALAVEYARDYFSCMKETVAVVIGAGKMGQLSAKYLHAEGVKELRIVNRTTDNALALAQEIDAIVFPLEELEDILEDADLIVCGTASPDPIITRETLERARFVPRDQLFIDIALPADIDPRVGDIPGVSLVGMDILGGRARRNQSMREAEIRHAEEIVHEELGRLGPWPLPFHLDEVSKSLGVYASQVVEEEMGQLLASLGELDASQREAIQYRMKRLSDRIILAPRRNLRDNPILKTCPEARQCMLELFKEPGHVRLMTNTNKTSESTHS